MKTLLQLDYQVGRSAFEDGYNQKEIALMLIAGSSYVAKLYREQGKAYARAYVNRIAKVICHGRQEQQQIKELLQKQQLEL